MKNVTARQIDNAKRLAYGLEQSATPQVVSRLAQVLNYNKEQLALDIKDLAAVLQEVNAHGE